MAKTVKFRLPINNSFVSDIDELKKKISINDFITLYNNGLLFKWFKSRDYSDEWEFIDRIKSLTIDEICLNLDNKLGIKLSEFQKQKLCEAYSCETTLKSQSFSIKSWLENIKVNIEDYLKVVTLINKNVNEPQKIIKGLKEFFVKSRASFLDNFINLFDVLKESSLKNIYCLLVDKEIRQYYLLSEDVPVGLKKSEDFNVIRKKLNIEIDKITDILIKESINKDTVINKTAPWGYTSEPRINHNNSLDSITNFEKYNNKVISVKCGQGKWENLVESGKTVIVLKTKTSNNILSIYCCSRNAKETVSTEYQLSSKGSYMICDGLKYYSQYAGEIFYYIVLD